MNDIVSCTDENADSCPTTSMPMDITQTDRSLTIISSTEIFESSSGTTIIIGVMGGLIAILVLTTVVLSVTVLHLIHQRKLKSIMTDSNPAYDGMWF